MMNVNLRIAGHAISKLLVKGRPCILMGPPGIGKSSVFRLVTKELGIGCKVTEASGLDPTDTRGIPYVVDGKSMYGKPCILPNVEKDGKEGILVIDEIASCMPAVQVSLYSLFLENRLGDYDLPKGWVPAGTGNYTTDGAVAYNLSTALTDRVFIINVEPDLSVWKEDFAYQSNIDPIIMGFLNFRPELFYTFGERNKTEKGKAFASPRSYELASDALSVGLNDDAILPVLAGCLGDGTATELVAFSKTYKDLPDIYDLFKGKYDKVPPSSKPDVLYALSGAIVGFLRQLPKGITAKYAVDRMFEYSLKLPAEFAILTIKDAIKLSNGIPKLMSNSKHWSAFSKKYSEVIG